MSSSDFLKQAAGVASYYGFIPLEMALEQHKKDPSKKKTEPLDLKIPVTRDIFSKEICSLMKTCAPSDIMRSETPLQFYNVHTERAPRERKAGNRPHRACFGLTILGVKKSVAEALILKSSLSILEECGIKNGRVYINSIGDKDSAQRFSRELGQYLRKNLNNIPAPAREAFKRDVFDALEVLVERKDPILEKIPRPMQFLSDASRKHLREVLEFLEITDTPYEVRDELVGSCDYYSQTLFEIRQCEEDEPEGNMVLLARGGRCDDLTRRLFRTDLPAVSIILERQIHPPRSMAKKWTPPRPRRPKIYFIQLGARAKLLSFPLIETLRKEKIPIRQAIGNDSLTIQLEEAQNLHIPYTIIMGQREALDSTVIVRNMGTHAQDVVQIADLPRYLKKIKI